MADQKESFIFDINATTVFSTWSGDAYSNDIFRSGVDVLARTAAKLKGAVYQNGNAGRRERDSRLSRLLQIEPNPFMTAYDFLYKVATHYFLHNNSFVYIQKDESGSISAFYPLDAVSVEILKGSNGIYIRFYLQNGVEFVAPYERIIHLRRHFNSSSYLGDSNYPIQPILELAQTQTEGISGAIKNGAAVRGILNFTSIMSDEKKKTSTELFERQFLDMSKNNLGVIATDATMEYVPLDKTPAVINESDLKAVQEKIYSYLGINSNIVTGSYTESEWNAFYENVMEPFSLQMSQEFTRKVFTERERAFGNEIVFSASRALFANIPSKVSMVRVLSQAGILSIDEIRELFNLPPLGGDEGKTRIMSLNSIDADIANDYQTNKSEQ